MSDRYVQRERARGTERTAAAIQAAALRELSMRGYRALRLEDVARRARVARRTLYLHAASKERLVERALRGRAEGLVRRVERWRPRADGAEEVIEELVALHARSYRAEKALLDTLLDGGLPRSGTVILRELDAVRLEIISRTMTDLARQGALRIRTTEATALAHALLAYPTWRVALTGPAGRRAQRVLTAALRTSVLV
ncbi:MAG: TetR family transcriptional regulator [Chloroflexota bacterium]|nr:TetR family transcriptional regulator [Chloroflexota bacterium]